MSEKNAPTETIRIARPDPGLLREITRQSGVDVSRCYHCRSCAGGCPFYEAMDYAPHAAIRLLQLGQKRTVLESSTIWICAGCNTCSIQCPQGIDTPAVMDALRQKALEEGVKIAEPDILNFHKDVLHSIKRYGRTHKFEIMARYKLRKRDFFSDMKVGMKMFTKGKLELRPSKVCNIQEIRRLFPKPSSKAAA